MQRYSIILLSGALASLVACSSNGPGGIPFDDDASVDADDVTVPGDKAPPTDNATPDVAPDIAQPDVVKPDVTVDVATDIAPDITPDVPVDVAPDVTCPAGQSACGITCVNLQTDNGNCGACGATCAGTQSCVGGTCMPMCTGGLTRCSGMCVDTQTSTANCGLCGNACPTGQGCELGACVAICTAEETRCGGRCVNTRSDGMNCGSCGNACPSTQMCSSGACVTTCSAGQALCGAGGGRPGSCVDLASDNANCGSCGNACPAAQRCAGGMCGCPTGQSLCGSACVTTLTDNTNCGMCGRACPTSQSCAAGVCACPTGLTVCGSACVDTQTSTAACGRCGLACNTGELCVAGVCTTPAPANDSCATPTVIDLTRGPALTITGTTSRATDSANTCRPNADVFYQFTLTAREIVYFDTFGTMWDTYLGLQRPGCAAAATNCTDDSCLLTQSQFTATLDAGTYLVVVDQFGTGGGDFTLHVQHYPAGGTVAPLDLSTGSRRLTGTTSGTGVVTSTCCSGGAENTYFTTTCPNFTEVAFRASTCDLATFDTELDFRSGNRAAAGGSICNDDTGGACGLRSTVSGRVPAGAGLHVLYADACSGFGPYGIDLLIGDCATGLTSCGAACVDLQTSATNCGACGNVCATGRCSGGVCTVTRCTRTVTSSLNITNPYTSPITLSFAMV
ncbi:MAG: MXAN_6577-like cysteine-rich protein, partial [Polyangiales bacterium]